jgi:EAL domain-containing protein (putative c-di-GMP-specific phosphodiesterase class I)
VLPTGLTLQTSGSIGVTVKRRAETSPDELLRQADVAMYRAKKSRSSLEVYEPADDTSAPHRMMLLGEVRRAIRNSELELHYQPIVDCLTAEIVRFEALLRWRHPTLGLLPPADFIELTELSNLNADVVLHCLEIAITDAQRWSAAGHPMPISINIAGSTLHDTRLMDSILRRVDRAGLPRHVIGVELTERQLLLGSGQSIRSLHRMVEAGLWMSIDDFGTGTSSLAALRQIPAHELKIDKSFVNDLRTGGRHPVRHDRGDGPPARVVRRRRGRRGRAHLALAAGAWRRSRPGLPLRPPGTGRAGRAAAARRTAAVADDQRPAAPPPVRLTDRAGRQASTSADVAASRIVRRLAGRGAQRTAPRSSSSATASSIDSIGRPVVSSSSHVHERWYSITPAMVAASADSPSARRAS